MPAFAALALACGSVPSDAWLRAKAAGDRATGSGRLTEAASAYAEAQRAARWPRDRDEAQLLEAATWKRLGAYDKATAAYRDLLQRSPQGGRAERATFELAEVALAAGDAPAGFRLLEAALVAWPGSGHAPRALARLVSYTRDAAGDAAALALYDSLLVRLASSELDETLRYGRATLLEARGDAEGALAGWLACAERHPYPFGALFDDALWHAADAEEHLGRPERAAEHLREMLRVREPSTFGGSYDRPRFPEAQLRLARLLRDALHDRAGARRELARVYDEFPASRLCDDALWDAARLAREEGDAAAACSLGARLVRDLPTSRYAACVAAVCAEVKPPPGTRCRAYVLEALGGAAR